MGDVLALTRLTEAIALDGMGQNHRWLFFLRDCVLVSSVDLIRVMTTAGQTSQLLVAVTLNQLQEFRIFTKEMFTDVIAFFKSEMLHLTIEDFVHTFDQQARIVLFK